MQIKEKAWEICIIHVFEIVVSLCGEFSSNWNRTTDKHDSKNVSRNLLQKMSYVKRGCLFPYANKIFLDR